MTHTSLENFFALHPVFTVAEVDRFLAGRHNAGTANPATRQALLTYYRKQGRLQPVRRGLYAVAPAALKPGAQPSVDTFPVDTFLIASRLAPDAVLAYHAALELHGLAHFLREERIFLSEQVFVRPLRFAGVRFRAVPPPFKLPAPNRMNFGVETHDRHGLPVRVTGIERTLVDVLDRPALAGGWEEAWRACEDASLALDFPLLLEYARLLGNATTAAKLGYALEAGRERLAVPAAVLDALHALAPRQPHPVERGRRGGTRLVPTWNLLVPAQDFGEPAEEWSEGEWEEEEEEETLR